LVPNTRFVFIDALRGLAALGVVLFHAEEGHHITELFGHLPHLLQIVLENGSLGVPIFFVLSGFVIAHSLYDQRMSLSLLGRFTLRRSLRLDPPYWVAIALAIGIGTLASAFVKGRPPNDFSLGQVVAHIFYLQDILGYRNIDSVFWTLCFEIQFYLVYAILLAVGRNDPEARFSGRRTTILLLIAGSVSLLWPLGLGPELPNGLFPPLWHGFLLGVGAYWSWRDRGAAPVFAAYALIIGASAIAHSDNFSLACVITSVSLFLVGATNRLRTAWNWRWLQFLGAISYSLYLIHNPVTGAVFRVGFIMTGRTVYWEAVWWCASIATCIAFASAIWWAIERPSVRLARKVSFPTPRAKRVHLHQQPSPAE
jgi:peptidoglycan/LPS O-acetylase OafA/YrhL